MTAQRTTQEIRDEYLAVRGLDPTAQNWQGDLSGLDVDTIERRMNSLARAIATRIAFGPGEPNVAGPGERRSLVEEYREANDAWCDSLGFPRLSNYKALP